MKKCPKCGIRAENEAKVCSNCGNVFPEIRPLCQAGVVGLICSIASLVCIHTAFIVFLIGEALVGEAIGTDTTDTVIRIVAAVLCILAIACCILGFIFSLKGFKDTKKENMRGRGIASAGLIMSSILGGIGSTFIVIQSMIVTLIIVFIVSLFQSYGESTPSSNNPISYRDYETQYTEPTYTDYNWYETSEETTTTEKRVMTFGTGPETINLWSFTDEIPKMADQYVKQNPEFGEKYTVECTIIATDGGAYQKALDNALAAGGDEAPDIYSAEAAFVLKYTQGDMAKFASTYKDLGIDVNSKIKEADIAKYSVDIGTRDGEVVALGYQSTGCAMIYNAEIAKEVFGTDDPEEIEKIVGAGSGNWDKFFEAAAKLKEKGYAAVSGPADIWNACEKSADKAWLVDGQLTIDPKREKYLDLAKTIKDNGYSNDTVNWSEGWYDDMMGEGEQKVFAFFGPAWLINYVMVGNSKPWPGQGKGTGTYGQWRVCAPPVGFFWGGTWLLANKDTDQKEGVAELIEWITLDTSETGLQYLWANGLVDWDNDPETVTSKDTVASAVVMAKSDGTLDFCGGQNIFPAFISGNKYASAKAMTLYDETISGYFTNAAMLYAEGKMSKEEAMEQFKQNVKENVAF